LEIPRCVLKRHRRVEDLTLGLVITVITPDPRLRHDTGRVRRGRWLV